METPWVRARKQRHVQQEERIGKMPNGRKQVNSGRFWRWKRDGIIGEFLIEARTTEAESYRIERKEFLDIRKQAFSTPPGLMPAMQIDIQELSLIAFELSVFNEMYNRLIALEAKLEEVEEIE